MTTFSKKTVYHSELVKAGAVCVTFKDGAMPSKFPKDGASHHAYFTVVGEIGEHDLIIEDAALPGLSNLPSGEPVMIEAAGSRETAVLKWRRPADGQVPQDAPAASSPAQGDILERCVNGAVRVSKLFGEHGYEVEVGPIFSTLYIQAHRNR